jgi:hypothetical protein
MFYTYEDARDDIKIAKNNPTELWSTPNNGGKILEQSRMSRSVVMLSSNGFIIITFLFFVQIFFVLFNYVRTKSAKIPSVKIIGASICIIIVFFLCVCVLLNYNITQLLK